MRTPPKLNQADLIAKFEYKDGVLYRIIGTEKQKLSGKWVQIGYHRYAKDLLIYTLHHADTDTGTGMKVDHIDGNTNNYHIDNLALITPEQYEANKANHKYYDGTIEGTKWDKKTYSYLVVKDGRLIGRYPLGDIAAQVYKDTK